MRVHMHSVDKLTSEVVGPDKDGPISYFDITEEGGSEVTVFFENIDELVEFTGRLYNHALKARAEVQQTQPISIQEEIDRS